MLLAGAALVAVPLVLHLLMRRKPRLLEFPALRFLQPRHDTNQRQLRLRHLLLLALRMAFIALVALALARPSIRVAGSHFASQEAPVAVALVFDTSKRMEYRHENHSRLEVAEEMGLWLLGQFPPESQVAVLDSRAEAAAFQVDIGAARHRIERLETAANARPITAAVDEAVRLLGDSPLSRKEVYVFSDLARTAWPMENAGQLRERLAAADVGVNVIDVGVSNPSNFSLGDLRLSGEVLSNRSPLGMETEISATGAGGRRTIELYMLAPGATDKEPSEQKSQERGVQIVELSPGESRTIGFSVNLTELGTHQGFLQIVGQDGLTCDDRRYFTVEVKPAWSLLLVAPKPADRYAVFLAQALAPTTFRRRGEARFDCTVISQEALAAQSLDKFAAVCLLDPKPLGPAVWQKLTEYASDGHGVALFLGRNATPVDSFNAPVAQEVLPGRLLRQANWTDNSVHLAPRDFEHPILTAMRPRADSIPWFAFPIRHYWQVEMSRKGVQVVLPLSNGDPALIEKPLGKGRVLVMTTPVSDDPNRDAWNLLPVGDDAWPFVMLANGMASYLVGSSNQVLNYTAGQKVELPLDPQHPLHAYVMTGPGGIEVTLTPDLDRNVVEAAGADRAGNYRVRAGGSEGVDWGFSVNLAAEQTRLDRLAEDDLAQLFGPLGYHLAHGRDEIETNISTGRVGREIFALLMIVAVVALAFEYVLANRFYKE
jgi:hypothetical protein